MHPQPLIVVHDVPASSRWYQAVLGCESGHGGPEYERLMHGGTLIMQLHHWDAHEHPYIGVESSKPYGNGTVLWFQTDDFDAAVARVAAANAEMLVPPAVNPNANHREVWLRDPDGYVVVIAGRYGDLAAVRRSGGGRV